MPPKTTLRIFAALTAAASWIGLVVQFLVLYSEKGSVAATLWTLIAYFTILTNLLSALVFTAVALDRAPLRSERAQGAAMLSMALVGVVYSLLLHGKAEFTGGGAMASALLHWIAPVLAVIQWLFFTVKGKLRSLDPMLWAIYPSLYFVWAVILGMTTGKYPYPFINVAAIGWMRTGVNAIAIALAFLACAWIMVWLDRRLAGREAKAPQSWVAR